MAEAKRLHQSSVGFKTACAPTSSSRNASDINTLAEHPLRKRFVSSVKAMIKFPKVVSKIVLLFKDRPF